MSLLKKISYLLLFILTVSGGNTFARQTLPASVAFYYNDIDSVRELINYKRVVVTPALISDKQIATLHKAGTKVFAYLSVGEYDGEILPATLKQHSPTFNQNWASHVMDLNAQPWQEYLNHEAQKLMARGFDGLFLDTLDSYTLFAKQAAQKQQQQQALTNILNQFNQLSSRPLLMLNRGFEVIEQLPFKPYAVVAESLYHSYHPLDNSYQSVPKQDTTWLRNRLNEVKTRGIEAIVIDYLPADNREKQKQAAQRLIDEGYTPYISDGMLYQYGVSTIVPVAKRVLGFYDGQYGKMTTSACHRMMAMPIEYYGYVPECRDIRNYNFTNHDLSAYAAVFIWLEEASYQRYPAINRWLAELLGTKPLLFVNSLPVDETLLSQLGIKSNGDLQGQVHQSQGKDWTKGYYPAAYSPFERHQAWQPNGHGVSSLIRFTDEQGKSTTSLFKAPWGGAVLSPFPVMSLANDSETWIIDPFRLVDETLSLPPIPAADATTEGGLRILTSHVDGDGFPSKAWFPGKPYTAEVLLEHVFKKYRIPQTVSVIEGEVGSRGLYPKESHAMENVARNIFKLPHIEVASHTFSHPFFWDFSKTIKTKQYGDNLPIPGYTVDYYNEIIGTADYINTKLAPKGKKVELILWSGKADPTEDILNIAEQAGLLNVNGGNTYVVKGNRSFTQVSSTIVWYPSAVQVYAPILNENLYTNLWTEHHDGYNRAIETFNILGSPRRLKTIGIYYHMYSGAYPASLKGLLDVYDWAIRQPATPLFLSEYATRARALYETGIAKTLNGNWQITSTGIKSIRVPTSLGYPSSQQIAGWNKGPDGHYLILSQPRLELATTEQPNYSVQLKSTNGQVKKWQNSNGQIQWAINSHVPLKATLYAKRCQLVSGDHVSMTTNKGLVTLRTNKSGHFSGTLRCQNGV
ncbi:RNA-binding protein [Photobacterium aquae]|uniref:RNA-binding protein n=1 Tax=Photobacterium aquae TaxID=1195763 RepID=A0A0J1H0N7_9GAMM|nr:endo alpha-1,4 polygalactosaminidase [Photobacterium aquae]KLV05381.1 RNA-binding protein [Photobacterium aquae]